MMQLPALSPDERAYLQSGLPNSALQALSVHLRRHFMVSLGEAVLVSAWPANPAPALPSGDEPDIRVDRELALAWVSVRFGGKPVAVSAQVKEGVLIDPLKMLIRRALAETVINLGDAAWPQALRLQLNIGPRHGAVEISWNSERAIAWAHRTIREKK